ncbi:MAG: hypothetical protein M1351_02165 [Candidatus Thermoplasmatota archaeon]|nr:hypothetical protein [Candidatus Thermoplasmatota archaeon]
MDISAVVNEILDAKRSSPDARRVRISDFEMFVLREIAKHTVNIFKSHGWFVTNDLTEEYEYSARHLKEMVAYTVVFQSAVFDYWPPDGGKKAERSWRTHKVSFSRAVHRLYRKGLVGGLALAWIRLDKSGIEDYEPYWLGGGSRRKEGAPYNTIDIEPRFKMLCLTRKGWSVVLRRNRASLLRKTIKE